MFQQRKRNKGILRELPPQPSHIIHSSHSLKPQHLNQLREISIPHLLDVVLRKSLRRTINSVLLHAFTHVSILDYSLSLLSRHSRCLERAKGGPLARAEKRWGYESRRCWQHFQSSYGQSGSCCAEFSGGVCTHYVYSVLQYIITCQMMYEHIRDARTVYLVRSTSQHGNSKERLFK